MDVVEDPHAPVVKVVTAPTDAAEAFDAFVRALAAWPRQDGPTAEPGPDGPTAEPGPDSPTAEGAGPGAVAVGTGVGAEVTAVRPDGRREVWGSLTRWEPPRLLAVRWHPGDDAARATDVEVRFSETSDGTRVHLRHTGWEARDDGAAARAAHDAGWDVVLGRVVERPERPA